MQRGGSTGHDEGILCLVAGGRTVAGRRTDKGWAVSQRRRHDGDNWLVEGDDGDGLFSIVDSSARDSCRKERK